MEKNGLHCWISGRVQGVFYRAQTCKQANKLNLTGWVKNLPDGRVEVLAFGETKQINLLHQWLHKGPPLAKVIEVKTVPLEWEAHKNFVILT